MSSKKKNTKNQQSKGQSSNGAPEPNKPTRSAPKAKKSPKLIKYSFNDLPIDVMNAVIDSMTTPTFLQFRLVSKKWMRLCWKARRTLDLTYIPASNLPKAKYMKQLFAKAHGLRSLKTHLNMPGSELAEALDLENACMSLTSILLETKLQNCHEESFLVSAQQHLTRFTEIGIKSIHGPQSKSFVGFTHLTQLQSLELGNFSPEYCFGLINLKNLVLHIPVYNAVWGMVLKQAHQLESLSISIQGDQWTNLDLPSLTHLKRLKLFHTQKFNLWAAKLNEIVSALPQLEEIEYPPVDRYYLTYYSQYSEDWDCHKAAFPATIKKIKNVRTRTFAGFHSCLNLESLSVVAFPKNENLEELNGLAKLQEFFVLSPTLVKAKEPNPGFTDDAVNHLKHATGLHTLLLGFGWGAFTNLVDIHQFHYLRHLALNGYWLTSQAITNIAQCKQLFSLAINQMRDITAMTFKPLTRLKYLTVLMLYNMEDLTEKTTRQLDELTQLRDLRLTRCKNVNDQALMNMSTIIQSHLVYLDVTETSIGAKGRQFVHHLLKPSKREHLWWIEQL